jgi:hypothetical protein
MESSAHDVINNLMLAGIHAERMAEQWPHHADTLLKFEKDARTLGMNLWKQLAREGLYGREPYDVSDQEEPQLPE